MLSVLCPSGNSQGRWAIIRCRSFLFVPQPLLAFTKALRDRGSSEDQRGLICESLGEVGMVLLHDIEHRFLCKPAMVVGQEFMQVSELFVVHDNRASIAIPYYTATC